MAGTDAGAGAGAGRTVRLLWCVRDPAAFGMFDGLLSAADTGFSAAAVEKGAASLEVKLQLHVTSPAAVLKAAEVEPGYRRLIRRGRPDYTAYLQGVASQLGGGHKRVAVFFCGPRGAAAALHKAILSANMGSVQFDLHQEVFQL